MQGFGIVAKKGMQTMGMMSSEMCRIRLKHWCAGTTLRTSDKRGKELGSRGTRARKGREVGNARCKLILLRRSYGGLADYKTCERITTFAGLFFGLIYEQGSGVGGWFFPVYPWPKVGWAKFVWPSAMLSGARDLFARPFRHQAPASIFPARSVSKALVERVSSDRLTRFGWVS